MLTKRITLSLLFKLSYLNSNLELTPRYPNPALNNSAPVDSVIQLLNNWGLDSFIFQSLITHQKFLRPSVLRKVQKFSIIGTTSLRGRRSKSPILTFEFSSGTRVSSPANVNIAFLLIFNCKSAVVYCFATMMR